MNHQDLRIEVDAADRRDVAHEIESWVRIEHRVDDVRIGDEQQRVAVRRRANDRFGGDAVAGGAAIFDDERLAEPLRQYCSGQPRDDVGGAARRKADQQMDRPRRISVGARAAQHRRQRNGACCHVRKRRRGSFMHPARIHGPVRTAESVGGVMPRRAARRRPAAAPARRRRNIR